MKTPLTMTDMLFQLPASAVIRATHSTASDVRAWWPACVDYSPGDPGMSRDAATWAPQDGAA